MVSIALGATPVDECAIGDGSGDGQITVDEIIRAVNRALEECEQEGAVSRDGVHAVNSARRL